MALRSRNIRGNLAFYDTHRNRIVDAIGASVCKYIEDFVDLPVDDTTGDPTAYTFTPVEAGTGNSIAALKAGADGGVLLITTDDAEDDGVNLQLKGEAFKLASGKPLYYGIRMKISDATQSDFIAGLCITDTTLLGGMTDGVYFRKVDGSTTVSAVLEKDSTETTGTAHTAVADTFVILEFWFDGTSVHFYVDGVEITLLAQTNLCDDEWLTPSIHFLSGSAGAKTMEVDWVRCVQFN